MGLILVPRLGTAVVIRKIDRLSSRRAYFETRRQKANAPLQWNTCSSIKASFFWTRTLSTACAARMVCPLSPTPIFALKRATAPQDCQANYPIPNKDNPMQEDSLLCQEDLAENPTSRVPVCLVLDIKGIEAWAQV
ncbi:hypothetical protein [Pseudomonas sp. LB3P25]